MTKDAESTGIMSTRSFTELDDDDSGALDEQEARMAKFASAFKSIASRP